MDSSKIEIVVRKDNGKYSKNDKIRIVTAIIFFVASLSLVIYLSFLINDSLQQVGYVSPEPRNVTIPLHVNLNGTRGYVVDVSFTFDFVYHNGTLIVDEPVDIDGIAVFLSKKAEEIKTIQVFFQNALVYNATDSTIIRDYYGIPQQGYLLFNSSQSGILYPFSLTENKTVIWTIDGSYHPIIACTYKNGTTISPILIEDVAITVFPKEQLTQIQISEMNTRLSVVNTWLAIAVFLLSIFNIITIFMDIYPIDNINIHLEPQEKVTQEIKQRKLDPEMDKQESEEQLPDKKQESPQNEME